MKTYYPTSTIKAFVLGCLPLFLLTACQSPSDRTTQVEAKARAFFQTFAERSDWDKLCSFYDEALVFDDVLLQLHLDSLWQFKRFYQWDDTVNVFEKLTPDQEHLVVRSLVVHENMAVATGYFNPFRYNGHLVENDWGMDFTIWLYFDENLKIIRQTDWIEYDDYTLESTVARFRKDGLKTPEWLNLKR